MMSLPCLLLCLAPLAAQDSPARDSPPEPKDAAPRTAIKVEPGKPTIKTRELGHEPIGPITRLPKYILQDQKAIWTSPLHTRWDRAKWWAIAGGATAVLITQDRRIAQHLPNSQDQLTAGRWGSRIGAAYTLLPVSAGIYFLGTGTHKERTRETGILAFESLAATTLVTTAIKAVARRERPTEGEERGRFWASSGSAWGGSSFPSGHAAHSLALASVIAHQYPRPRVVPILAYGLAGTVVASRMAARRHFPSDVVAGAAMGWFIGTYIYGKRHNHDLDQKPSAAERVLSHVRIGASIGP